MNPVPVFRVLGVTMMFIASSILVPLLLALFQDDYVSSRAFSTAFCVSGFFGVLLFLITKGQPFIIGRRETIALTTLLALATTLLGALPLYLCGHFGSFFDATFEALSGITTTGLSVFEDPSVLSDSALLWRAMLQWIGGYATLILVIWALPLLGFGGIFLPARDAVETISLDPQKSFHHVVRLLFLIYGTLTGMCATSMVIAGMPLFDSICYSMSTLSTGGFLIDRAGPLLFPGVGIKIILGLFMLLGAVNFALHGRFISGDRKVYSRDPECRLLVIVLLIAIVLLLAFTGGVAGGAKIINEILRLLSVITTTGYPGVEVSDSSLKYILLVFVGLAVVGGTTGSTAGGFKLMRFMLLIREAKRELAQLIHPHVIVPIKFGNFAVTPSFMQTLWVFFIGYILTLVVLSVALSAFGTDFLPAVILSISALTNNGGALLHLSQQNMNLALLSDGAKFAIMLGMLAGRLELLAFFVLLNSSFWRP